MSSFSIFGSANGACNMKKIINANHLQSFMVQHFYPQKHVSWMQVLPVNENIKAGHYGVPECFVSSVNQSRYEQFVNNDTLYTYINP
jgi:hypothetical protein